jgi:acyl-CoA synthetase (AMP-forming)/AMP-acid ligase II
MGEDGRMGTHMNIGRLLVQRSLIDPDKEGLVCENLRLTFNEMNERANRLANSMISLGIKRGDRVGILALNDPEYYDMYFGLAKIGAVLVPVNWRLAGPEMQYILSDCGVKILVFGSEYFDVVDTFRKNIPADQLIAISDDTPKWARPYNSLVSMAPADEPELVGEDDDTLTILYTSGTTGRPKGAELTHAYYFYSNLNLTMAIRDVGDTYLTALPLFHIGALGGVPWAVHMGAKVVLMRKFEPVRLLEHVQEERVNCFGSVPSLLMLLREVPGFENYDWSSIATILIYAAPVPVSLLNEYKESGIQVRQLYGMTEANTATILDAEHAGSKIGSCGKPYMHTQIRIVDSEGKQVGPNEPGEVLMKGPNMMKGYWNRPKDTEAAIVDGWLHSGDIATVDEEGFVYIMDRKKDMIISGGENIYPAEIEDALLGHEAISDAAVIGYPHETWGEAVKAVVVLREGEKLTESELINWCNNRIGRYKIPKAVIFTNEIPRSPTGKILKRILRERFN